MSESKAAFRVAYAKKTFGSTTALNIRPPEGDSVAIYRGQTTAILGLSGSGKSTFLNLLGLLEDADQGSQITYYPLGNDAGLDYANISHREKRELRNKAFGVAFQDGHLIGHISVNHNIKLPLSLAGANPAETGEITQALAGSMKIAYRINARPKELSGGEYHRVAVARAIAHNPTVVFADEPTGNLDSDTGDAVMRMLVEWRRQSENNTMILVTHDIHQAYRFADRFLIFQDGQVIHCFAKDSLDNAEWRKLHGIEVDATDTEALLKLLENGERRTQKDNIFYPQWSRIGSRARQATYLFWYGLVDLFPIKFKRSVFLTTLRDTLFSVLTISSVAILVLVLLLGYGIVHGVSKFEETSQKGDIRANRLIVQVAANSKVDEIDDDLLAELGGELAKIRTNPAFFQQFLKKETIPKYAVNGIYGFANAQISIFRPEGDMIWAMGTTVQPNSPLLSRLTYQGKKLSDKVIETTETEGLVVSADWLKSALGLLDDAPFPKYLWVSPGREGEKGKEKLPLLAVVDDLPDSSFLISPGFWHKYRDQRWRPKYKSLEIKLKKHPDIKNLVTELDADIKSFHPHAVIESREQYGSVYIVLDCGCEGGWRTVYWRSTIYPQRLKPIFQRHDIALEAEPALKNPAYEESIRSPLTYLTAAVYLNDISAVSEVAHAIRTHPTGLTTDKYLESLYKQMNQSRQLSLLVLGFIAVAAFALSASNIALMFSQTTLRKRHDIGILKAFGASGQRIGVIFLIESIYIFILASATGVAAAVYIGEWAGYTLQKIYDLNGNVDLFYLDWSVTLAILSGIFLLTLTTTYLTTLGVSRKTANELLRQRD